MNIILRIIFWSIGIIILIGVIYRLRIWAQGGNLTVTSWWRSPWHNDEVGGITYSKHLLGLAFDIVPVNDITGQILKKMGFANIINEQTHFHAEIL